LAKTTNHASKCKKVYETEAFLKDKGYFVFRRTSPHGLFHVIGFKGKETLMVQVLRLHSFNFADINNEMVKIQDHLDSDNFPDNSELELWVWVNNKGWIKYYIGQETGKFHKYEDYGTNDFRKKK
jgi:hypothetical protein